MNAHALYHTLVTNKSAFKSESGVVSILHVATFAVSERTLL